MKTQVHLHLGHESREPESEARVQAQVREFIE